MESERGRWWASFALLAAGGLAWAVATPIFAAPDEPAHVIRAASAGRGELLGHAPPPAKVIPEFGNASVEVTAPGIYGNASEVACFAFHPNHPAGCFHMRGPDRDVEMVTYVGHHPPAYYAVVGLLSRLVTAGEGQVYLMRALGALAIAALLASSIATLGRVVAPIWAGAGLAVALSPMVLFLAGTVSASGIETGAAIGVWVHGAVLATEAGEVEARVVDRFGIAAGALVLSRALSPLWLVVIGAILLLLVTRERLSALLRSRRVWSWGLVIGACLAVQAWWYLYADPLGHFVGRPLDVGTVALVRTSIGKTPRMLREMVGVFGWLDTKSPAMTIIVWGLVLGALVGLALAFVSGRFFRALVAASVAALVLPIIIESLGAGEAGPIWQGRYTLPLAVGIPLLAGLGLGSSGALRHASRRLPITLVAALIVAQIAAYEQALRRYAVGAKGAVWFFPEARWEPPIPAPVLIVLYAIIVGVMLWWIVLSPRPAGRDAEEPAIA